MAKAKNSRSSTLADIKKKFGVEILPASKFTPPSFEVIPTGSVGLDIELGTGGYPAGRIIEIWGGASAGKSSMCLHAAASALKKGMNVAFVDAEHALDMVYAKGIGVDLDKLDYFRPDSGEEALEIVEMLAKSSEYGLIIIDSVAALVPTKEQEGEMGASHVGLQARLMGQAMRKLVGVCGTTGTTLMFINQVREKVGIQWGSNETTSGGKALGFYASVRLSVSRIGSIKKGDRVIGGRTKVKIVKNKLAGTAYHTVEFDMFSNNEFGCGISKESEIFDYAVKLGLIDKAGAWFSYNGEQIGQGKDNSVRALKDQPGVLDLLEAQVRSQITPNGPQASTQPSEGSDEDE